MSPPGEAGARRGRRRTIAHTADAKGACHLRAQQGGRMSPPGEAEARRGRRRTIAHTADAEALHRHERDREAAA